MATNNNSIHPQLQKFIGKNFDNQYIQMYVLFRSHDLGDPMYSSYIKVTDSKEFEALSKKQKDSLKDSRKKDKKAFYTIFQAVNGNIFDKIQSQKQQKRHGLLYKNYTKVIIVSS